MHRIGSRRALAAVLLLVSVTIGVVALQPAAAGAATSTAGMFRAVAPVRLLDTTHGVGAAQAAVGPGRSIAVQMTGRGGVPASGVSSVVVNVMVYQPSAAGYITVWGGGTRPGVSSLSFVRGQRVPNLVVAPVDANGRVWFYNGSSGTVQLFGDASGYLLSSALPAFSTSHYVRNITGASSDYDAMHSMGAADAAAGSSLVLLDIGAQLNDKTGVALSVTDVKITYPQLVHAVQGYLDGFGAGAGATVAVGTNNGANDWMNYTAQQRGADWADKVIDLLNPGTGVSVVGANDIEGAFFSTEAQAQDWENAYLGATSRNLVFNGSADGCPTTLGSTGHTCAFGWMQADYYALAGGGNSARIHALPQIYNDAMALQWANIDATGGKAVKFAGALTEYGTCPTGSSAGCNGFASVQPLQGWASLKAALGRIGVLPAAAVTDLRVN